MAEPVTIRGDKAHLRITVDGEISPLMENVGCTYRSKATTHSSFYGGNPYPRNDLFYGGYEGSLEFEVISGEIDELIQRFEDASIANVARPQVVINIIEEYPNGEGVGITTFTDVILIYSERRHTTVQEKVMKSIAFTASRKIFTKQ